MTREVGLGSIGLGWWGKTLADAARATGEARIVSCFARGEEGREAFASQFGCRSASSLDELLSDPDVEGVLVATANLSHRGIIERAAAAGKAVFVEKPLTNTVDEGIAAVEAAEAAGVVLQVGHQRRRTAANRRIKAMLDAGELGDLEALEAVQSVPNGFRLPANAWRWDAEESPLGGMMSLGIHKLDSMRYHAGPVESVFCYTRSGREHPIDEVTALALRFESGVLGTLITSFFTARISELTVYGQDATAFNQADGTKLFVQRREDPAPSEVELEPIDATVDQMAEFVRAIRGETTPEVGGREGLEIVAIVEAAIESAASGRSVAIADHRP